MAKLFRMKLIHSTFLTLAGLSWMAGPVLAQDPVANQDFTILLGAPVSDPVFTVFGVGFDGTGTLYGVEFEEGNRLFRLGKGETKQTFIGGSYLKSNRGSGKSGGDGGNVGEALFSGMHDLAVLRNGDLLLAETWSQRVRRVDGQTAMVSTLAGTGQRGYSGDGGPAADANNSGIYSCYLTSDESQLYLADLENARVRRVDLKTGRIQLVAGNGKKGPLIQGALATETPVPSPRAVTVAPDGTVYIVSREGNALFKIERSQKITTVVNVTGTKGTGGDGGDALQAQMNGPKNACTDSQGNVYIADAENHTIRKYDPLTGKIWLLAGTPGKNGTGVGELNRPHGVCVGPDHWLYIADSYNHRVVKVRL